MVNPKNQARTQAHKKPVQMSLSPLPIKGRQVELKGPSNQKKLSRKNCLFARRTMTIKTSLKMLKERQKDSTLSTKFSNSCRIRRPWSVWSFHTLMMSWQWLRKTYSDLFRTSRSLISSFLRLVLKQRMKLIQHGPIYREFMSFSFNLSSMRLSKLGHWKFT